MRLMIIIMLFSLFYLVSAKSTNVKQLTESLGREVIEIGTPIKELPVGLEEEPTAEDDTDDDEKAPVKTTGNTAAPTKKDMKKATTQSTVKKEVMVEKVEGLNPDEDEARIEKELSEIYKDTADYKSDSAEEKEVAKETESPAPVEKVTEEESSDEETDSDKAIGRQKSNFKLQPYATDKDSIEKFRTSRDDISCDRQNQKLTAEETPSESSKTTPKPGDDAFRVVSDGFLVLTAIFSYVFMCT